MVVQNCLSEEENNKNIELLTGSFFNNKDNKNEYKVTRKQKELLEQIESFIRSNEDYYEQFGYDAGEAHPGMNGQFYEEVKNGKELNLNDKRVQYLLTFHSERVSIIIE